MALLNGIAIADPSKKALNFTTNEGFRQANVKYSSDNNDILKTTVLEGVTSNTEIEYHFLSALKDPQLPHTSNGDQEIFRRHDDDYPSVYGFSVDESVTIPYTNSLRTIIEDDKPYAEENEALANVEKDRLEADKNLIDTDINGGAWYDPQGIYKTATFKRTDRWVYRIIRNPASKLANSDEYSDEKHYLYVDGRKSFQDRYYTNNPWRDSNTGRVQLFEAPRTASRLG